jgi:hypothetical protein
MKPFLYIGIIAVFVVLAGAPSYYFYHKYQTLQQEVGTSQKKDDVVALMARVGKHILLPTSETPTVMTVTDKEKLSGQLFFANAKNGDKVLVYEKAKKAFLYDPDADKIIEVGPIVLTASTSATLATGGPTPTPATRTYTFTVLNATLTKGLAETYETTLVSKVPGAQVVTRGNAKGDYTTSLLVDVTGTHKDEASVLAKTLSLEISSMPAGEATPSSTFLIILGNDQK